MTAVMAARTPSKSATLKSLNHVPDRLRLSTASTALEASCSAVLQGSGTSSAKLRRSVMAFINICPHAIRTAAEPENAVWPVLSRAATRIA